MNRMEYEVVILKPAELILKSKGVRKQFEQKLLHNVKDCLKKKEIEFDHVVRGQARYFIYTPEPDEVLSAVKNIFGLSNIFKAAQVGADIKAIKTTILDLAEELGVNKKSTFGIRATTVNSNIKMSSREVETEVGSYIQEKTKAKVNLTKPDFWLRAEIVGPKAFIYSEAIEGFGGLPLGTAGKALALISEKEQDILAAWLIMRRGCEIIPLHIRETESELIQFQKNCKKLEKFAWGSKIKPISIKGPKKDRKEIEKKAEETGCKAIILGSLDHKTLECNIPIFEPIVGLDQKQLKALEKIVF
jgi:tRNA uracil 4-sulfurtransferase